MTGVVHSILSKTFVGTKEGSAIVREKTNNSFLLWTGCLGPQLFLFLKLHVDGKIVEY